VLQLLGRWLECVPNFSEGRDRAKIESIASAARALGAYVLNIHSDPDHNRSVVTLAAPADQIVEAVMSMIRRAVELLDIRHHVGVHPRIGVVDVVPFVPLGAATQEDSVKAAIEVASRVGNELEVPVYLYEWAARHPEYRALPDVRRLYSQAILAGNFLEPDFGPFMPHPTAGACVVGARGPLIAFNCVLGTPDVSVARRIAFRIRESSGGMLGVRALGLWLESLGLAQVSMNIVDPVKAPLHVVFERVKQLAAQEGTYVVSSELVGLMPSSVALGAASYALGLPSLSFSQLVEMSILSRRSEVNLEEFLDSLASSAPTPGGGAASALVGAIAAALSSMVANLTIGKKKYMQFEEDMRKVVASCGELRSSLLQLMHDDEEAYNALMNAFRLPKDTEEQVAARNAEIQKALIGACEVPLTIAQKCMEVLELSEYVAGNGNANAVSDAGVSALMAEAAARGALLNVYINCNLMKDSTQADGYRRRAEEIESTARSKASEVMAIVRSRINGG